MEIISSIISASLVLNDAMNINEREFIIIFVFLKNDLKIVQVFRINTFYKLINLHHKKEFI